MYTLVVESPAKAKTINKYLGKDFTVLASFGHVRDLPSKDGSVRPDEDFAMDYEVSADGRKRLSDIAKAVKESDILYLATDPDREGEAISWHVVEALRAARKLRKDIEIKRVTFTEITKKAVQYAVAHPRDIDMDLVNAQQARRALDYLVGFSLSPILWRKLPGARSAGRVQSVALRLVCERDTEIEQFVSREYWDIGAELRNNKGTVIATRLAHWKGDKLEKFSLPDEGSARTIESALKGKHVTVHSVTPKQMRRNPYAPFTTSTLQMDASRKLGMSAKQTMMTAQKLYEGIDIGGETTGLITYMRTDGVQVSAEAVEQARGHIGKEYGKEYLPEKPKFYSSKAKNAQEAHEAIRPTSITRTPQSLKSRLSDDQFRLYELIWKRMVASQMEPAVYDQVLAEFKEPDNPAIFRASGSVLKFDGFLKLYRQGLDDDQKEEVENQSLPPLNVGDAFDIAKIMPEQHFTEPPPRYTEASLVKRLEELGIGRPSTFAAILSVLQDRGYVRMDRKRFIAEMRGRLVNAFLESYFTTYVEYDFTADLEHKLDEISDGKLDWKTVLREFWEPFIGRVTETKEIAPRDILEVLDDALSTFIYGKQEVSEEDRICPKCKEGGLFLKTGKFGAFLGCNRYPDCTYTKPLDTGDTADDGAIAGDAEFPKLLGTSPTGADVMLKKGPYGIYVEMEVEGKPKRTGIPKTMTLDDVTLDAALALLSLPRTLGEHPDTGKVIKAGLGRFGPYLIHDGKYTTLKEDDVLTVGMNRAVTLIAEADLKRKGAAEPLKILGKHPDDDTEIAVFKGRYGPYVKYKKVNASLPKDAELEGFTLEDALSLIEAKTPKKPAAKKTPDKKAASAKTTAKTPAAKKTATKKVTSKKKAD